MNNLGRQWDAEVNAAYAGERELAVEAQRQTLNFDEAERNSNMPVGHTMVTTQEHVRQRIRDAFQPDATYRSAWKKFTEFVNQKRSIGGELETENTTINYLTRESVDLFFVQVVSTMNVSTRHAKRHASALQKYADNIEHIGKDFVVKSENVIESLNAQNIFKLDQDTIVRPSKPGNNLPCPHLGLRVNLCTPDEEVRFMEYVYGHAPETVSYKLAFCWTVGRTTFLRGQSIRNLLYYDLFTSDVYGPEENHPTNKHCLMWVLRKGNVYFCCVCYLFITLL